MKLVLVRLLTAVAFAAAAVAAMHHFRHAGAAVLAVLLFCSLSALMVTIAFLLDYPPLPRQPKGNVTAEELERRDLLVSAHYCADRAFRVHELDDEGPHYFLELDDGSILHLCGSYLHDYEPGPGSPRHFPCTNFILRRHKELGHTVDILCGGLIIEPEVEAPSYTERDFLRGIVPRDGEILHGPKFEQLLQQRLSTRHHTH